MCLRNDCENKKDVSHILLLFVEYDFLPHFDLQETLIYKNLFTIYNVQALVFRFYTPVFRRDVLWYGDVRPSVRPGLRPSVRHSFPHFSPTCFDILIWNFVYHFIFMHVRSSSNAINFRHFLQELCSFLTSNSYKYAVFRTFLLHALTYWVQILYMTLF